jgi:hypothetical protein
MPNKRLQPTVKKLRILPSPEALRWAINSRFNEKEDRNERSHS